MPLTLIAGPAHAGKVARLLDRHLERIDRDPFLIVPTRADVERVERDLLRRSPVVLGGSVGTFDDLFAQVAPVGPAAAGDAHRLLAARHAVAAVSLDGLARSSRHGGFADALLAAVGELATGLVEPDDLDAELGALYAAYREALSRRRLRDGHARQAAAAARLATDLAAWDGRPVLAYGFEDLTAAEWTALEVLAARADVTVSLPYEPGRAVFSSLRRTADDLARLADERIEELPPCWHERAPAALAHLERALFAEQPAEGPPLDGAIRFLEGAGLRGTLELVADEALALVRSGTSPERIAIVCPSVDRWRAPLETVFGALGVPFAIEAPATLDRTPFGRALLRLLRFAWLDGGRGDLYGFLRSPYSGVPRAGVDFVEGRLRGRAIARRERVVEESEKLRPGVLRLLSVVEGAGPPVAPLRELAAAMLENAYGLDRPLAADESRIDLRSHEAVTRVLDELEAWQAAAPAEPAVTREDAVRALERATVFTAPVAAGRIAVLDLLRARTRDLDAVFLLGLEEGSLPRRGAPSPFLDDDARRALGRRLERADPVARDRYLFYTACTRASRRLFLVREAASDEGSPREPSPFWHEVQGLFGVEEVARATRRRPLSALTWPVEDAPSERERLRALAGLAAAEPADAAALARANGWERRLARAQDAFSRPMRLRQAPVLARLQARRTFNVTELERMADCSAAWFFERYLDPRTIDAEVDAKLRGSVAHSALYKFFSGLPKELGADRVQPERVDDALRLLRRCLDDALAGVRLEMTDLARHELELTLWRDLEAVVRLEAGSPLRLEPRRFEVGFGTERAAPELQRGIDLGDGLAVSGKIDRIDVDPWSARGMVVDYKSGKGAHSAAEIRERLRLQIPLYMLVLRDLVGIEPLGGVYRALGGERLARGLLRAESADDLPGFKDRDYVDDAGFWEHVDEAVAAARGFADRIRAGDVRHDPLGGECPSWCDVWTMCRVRRA